MNGHYRLILPAAMLISFLLGILIGGGKHLLLSDAADAERAVSTELQAGYLATIHDSFTVTVANFDTVAIFPNNSFHREYSYGDQCLALAGGSITNIGREGPADGIDRVLLVYENEADSPSPACPVHDIMFFMDTAKYQAMLAEWKKADDLKEHDRKVVERILSYRPHPVQTPE